MKKHIAEELPATKHTQKPSGEGNPQSAGSNRPDDTSGRTEEGDVANPIEDYDLRVIRNITTQISVNPNRTGNSANGISFISNVTQESILGDTLAVEPGVDLGVAGMIGDVLLDNTADIGTADVGDRILLETVEDVNDDEHFNIELGEDAPEWDCDIPFNAQDHIQNLPWNVVEVEHYQGQVRHLTEEVFCKFLLTNQNLLYLLF